MQRIIKLTIALALALSGFLVAGAVTSGAQASDHAVSSAKTPATAARATRSVELIFKRHTRTSFKVRAHETPAGGKKKVILQYKRRAGGSFHKIRTAKFNSHGRAKFGVVHKLGYYRVVTKRSANYDRSYSNTIRVYQV